MYKIKKKTFYFSVLFFLLNGFCLFIASGGQRSVVLPLLVIINTAIFFFFALFKNRKGLPLFEIGVICMTATVVYSVIPLLMFLALGGQYTQYSSTQLLALHPTYTEMGDFAWYYVIYTASFAVVYLFLTRRTSFVPKEIAQPSNAVIFSIIFIFTGLSIFFLFVKYSWGVDFNRAYLNTLLYSGGDDYNSLSLLSRQLLQNLFQIKLLAMLALMLVLISKWHKRYWRYAFICWLVYEMVSYLFHMGSRTQIMIMGLAFMLLYHRLVHPLKFKTIVFLGGALLCVFLLFGLFRGGDNFQQKVDYVKHSGNSIILAANEFETLFSGTYDIYHMRRTGMIGEVPWQMQFSDLLFLIPSQILPTDKVDPQSWYLSHSPNPGYFMFNPIAQSIVGLGPVQLVINGGLLAFFFGLLHRWYVRNSPNFIMTLFYLFLTVWSYYSIRSSTFGFLYRIQFHFLPFILMVWFLQWVFRIRIKRDAKINMKKIIVLTLTVVTFLLFTDQSNGYTINYDEGGSFYNIKFPWFVTRDKFKVRIKNISPRTVNFELGLNNMLFTDKSSLIDYVKTGDVNKGLWPIIDRKYRGMIRFPFHEDYFRAFCFFLPRTFHHVELTDQYDSQQWAESPMLMVNSLGFGSCGIHAGILSKLWRELGYRTRERPLNGHVVPEVFNGKRWLAFDTDKKAFYFNKGSEIIGIDELKADPKLISQDDRYVHYPHPDYEYPQYDAGLPVANIIINSEGPWLKPYNTLSSDTDWIPLNVTIPPNATFSFPFNGKDIFFPEQIDDVPRYGEKVLTPKYKYAVLKVEKGTVGDINVGLYPFKIVGDCVLRINGESKQIKCSEFDQVNRFRSDRVFARTITLVGSESTVKIYYLLNNYTNFLKSNKLILKGAVPKDLKITVSQKKNTGSNFNINGLAVLEDEDPDLLEIIPKSVFATSNSYHRTELPKFLIDGNLNTDWFSDLTQSPEPTELIFDLGKTCPLAEIKWLSSLQYPFTSPVQYSVALSRDGLKYTQLIKVNDQENKKMVWHEIDAGESMTRYVKFILILPPHINQGFFEAGMSEVRFFVEDHEKI